MSGPAPPEAISEDLDLSLPELFESTSPKKIDVDDQWNPNKTWPTRGSTEAYVRPSHRLARKRQKERPLHASLARSIEKGDSGTELGTIPRTTGLQGDKAEEAYRKSRTVHTSTVAAPPLPATKRIEQDGDAKQICHFSPCKLMRSEDHLKKFMHECKHGVLCTRRGEPSHNARYFHRQSDDEDPFAGKTGWEADNWRSPYCMPSVWATPYQKAPPVASSNPRAGFRPHGGVPPSAAMDLKDSRKLPARKDNVVLLVSGFDFTWHEHTLLELLRERGGSALILDVAFLERGESRNSGQALVTVENYECAQRLRRTMHGRTAKANDSELTVAYRDPIAREYDRAPGSGRDGAVSRFNRAIKACGPYYRDAEALVERMRDEQHAPDAHTYAALVACYRDAQPAQAAKAEELMRKMQRSGPAPHCTICNLVVDCWCRAGNMARAEKLVAAMEQGRPKRVIFRAALTDADACLPLPNEETYQVLTDGWERLGLMDEMAGRQRGYKMDEDESERKPQVSIGGVVGIRAPAVSQLTSWARRRAGYISMNTGMMTQEMAEDNHSIYNLEKWTSRT